MRFVLRGEPTLVGLCHCLGCRKATGTVSMAYANWPPAAFDLSGETRSFVGRSFCPTCGTRVFNLEAGKVSIMLGALDDAPADLSPACEGWTIRRETWLQPVAGADQFERDIDRPVPSRA